MLVDQSLTVQGLGADRLTIDGNTGSIFLFNGANADKVFAVTGMTLTNAVNAVNFSASNPNDVLNLDRVVVRGNTDPTNSGSSVVVSFGQLNITDSAYVENSVNHTLDLSQGSTTIVNSTFSDNSTNAISVFPGSGLSNTLSMTNVTIAGNTRGVEVRSVPAGTDFTVTYENSIFADNSGGNFAVSTAPAGTLTFDSQGRNILDDATGDPTPAPSDRLNTDPRLAPHEANNGTFVRPLQSNSPAIDAVLLAYDSGSDEVRIVAAGNPANLLFAVDKDEFDGPAIVRGDGDDNTLAVDPSFYPLGLDIEFDGGGQVTTTIGDGLAVSGSGTQAAVYTPSATTTGAGTVAVTDGAATTTITFTGLEPVDITGMAIATLALPGGDDVLTVAEGTDFFAGGTNPALIVSGTTGGVVIETAAFWDNDEVVIDTTANDGNDKVTVAGGDNAHGNDSFAVTTGTGADLVTFTGSFAADGGDVAIQSPTISVESKFNIRVSSTGSGAITFGAARNVLIAGTGSLETDAGDITIDANTAGTETGTFIGILNAGRITSATGDIRLTATGGTTGNSHGIQHQQQTITSTGSGTIELTGTAVSPDGGDAVRIIDADITAVLGAIELTDNSSGGIGVRASGPLSIESTGTGADAATITITGTSTGTGGSNVNGVVLFDANLSITSVDGDIDITGTSADFAGVGITNATISSTGTT